MSYAAQQAALRRLYRRLLNGYPRDFRDRLAPAMLETFDDLCREHNLKGHGWGFVVALFANTFFAMLKEQFMQKKDTQRLALVSLVLLIPFGLVIGLGLVLQALHALGLAGNPDLGAVLEPIFGHSQMYYPVIFIFPLIAFALSAGSLAVRALRAGPQGALSLEFARQNSLTLAVIALGAGAAIFLSGHDAIPCFVRGLFSGGLSHPGDLLRVCWQA